jgi:hypothetical protein
MIKTRLKIIAAALILLMCIPGCRLMQPKKGLDSEPEKIEYRKGTHALEMAFLENFPRDEIKEGQAFQAIIEVQNKGAYDINDLVLSLTGIKEQYTQVLDQPKLKIIENLAGKSLDYPEGSKEIVTFNLKNEKRLPTDKHTELIKIDACYKYQTIASAEICINPSSQIVVAQSAISCPQDKTVSLSGGQGAPIAITKIEQITTPVNIEQGIYELDLKLHISHLGKGNVFLEQGCNNGGIVRIQDINFHNYQLGRGISCDFEGERTFVLEKKDNILKCNAQIDSAIGTFTTPLIITLEYWYEDSISKTIEVEKTQP